METINLTISNMKSPHCQMTVANTVNAIGVKVKSIAATSTAIELGNGLRTSYQGNPKSRV